MSNGNYQYSDRVRVISASPQAMDRFLGILEKIKEVTDVYHLDRDEAMLAHLNPKREQAVLERATTESPNQVWRDIQHYRPSEGHIVFMILDENPARPVEVGYWFMNDEEKPVWKYAENNQPVTVPILYWAYDRPGQDPVLVRSREG